MFCNNVPEPTGHGDNAHAMSPPRLHRNTQGQWLPDLSDKTQEDMNCQMAALSGHASAEQGQTLFRNLGQLIEKCGGDVSDVNGALAALHQLNPKDPIHALIATQMLGCHHLAMNTMREASSALSDDVHKIKAGLAVRLLNCFSAQLDALSRYQKGGEQNINVNHLHISDHAQAMIGSVKKTKEGH